MQNRKRHKNTPHLQLNYLHLNAQNIYIGVNSNTQAVGNSRNVQVIGTTN